ncbi:MAG: Uma2 family endonuclease [Desulfurellaceae bacterium]|nr:Uma2 family endonuclease [Desulfurellaceae bacterium]
MPQVSKPAWPGWAEYSIPVKINVQAVQLTDEQFVLLCQENPELRLEMTAQHELVIMPPTGSKTGWRNSKITQRLANWAETDGTGLVFDSSTGFRLPNGAKRSPDVSWLRRARWESLTEVQQNGFAPLCPDFVVELRSQQDRLATLQEKMQEYCATGAQLGWLIDPLEKRVHIYRLKQAVEIRDDPASLDGESILPGFVLDVRELW